ncbi:histidine kinase dimerization/phosphoacceptor domain -containing protein [Pontimicrobium sp. IMCC45349]|uniref:tetratricopeptide repeat-containing sensor histidine kinase n=1 Tax=Pontimicrobium sp. IMCC45349 TaxID=3391574 RepID=UPI0039A01894
MKKVIVFVFLLFSFLSSNAQSQNVKDFDKLSQKIKNTKNRDSISLLLKQQEAIARLIDDKSYLAEVFVSYGLNSSYDGEQMERYYNDAYTIFIELKDTFNLAKTRYLIAKSKLGQDDYFNVLKEADSASYWFNFLDDDTYKIRTHTLKSNSYSHLGDYANALSELNVAKEIALKSDDPDKELIRIYGSESLIHYSNKNFEDAIETLKKIVSFYEEREDYKRIVIWSNNLASTYFECNCRTIDTQETLLLKSIVYAKKASFTYGEAFANRLLASIYLKEKDTNKAKLYLDEIASLMPQIKVMDFKGLVNETYGSYWETLGDNQKAIDYFQKAYNVYKEIGSLNSQQIVTKQLAVLYNKAGSSKKAYYYLNDFLIVNDSLFGKEKVEELKELELTAKFEREKYVDSLQRAQEKQLTKLNHDLEIAKQKKNANILYSFLLVSALLALFAFIAFRKKKKQSVILDAKNKQIEKALHEKQLLLKEVHHRVKNNFQIVSSLLELQTKGIEDEQALKLAEEGKSRVKSMALIHQKLYQNEDLLIEFDAYVKSLVKDISMMYGKDKKPKININVPNYKFDIDTAIPLGLIINELITNAYKYGFNSEKQTLDIILTKEKNQNYILKVKDNGKGLPESFDFSKAKSLGLRLVRRLSKQLHGVTTYFYDNGANFSVTFKDTNARAAME